MNSRVLPASLCLPTSFSPQTQLALPLDRSCQSVFYVHVSVFEQSPSAHPLDSGQRLQISLRKNRTEQADVEER